MPKPKTERGSRSEVVLVLPANIELTEDERASVVQWVLLRRNAQVWTAPLIQTLLDWDSDQSDDPQIDDVREMLDELDAIRKQLDAVREGKQKTRRTPKAKYPAFVRFFVGAANIILKHAKTGGQSFIIPPNEEDQFFEIVRLWRLEHPEPPKQRQIPNGKTQHETDPDTD